MRSDVLEDSIAALPLGVWMLTAKSIGAGVERWSSFRGGEDTDEDGVGLPPLMSTDCGVRYSGRGVRSCVGSKKFENIGAT